MQNSLNLGATYQGSGITHFRVWAASWQKLFLEIKNRKIPMERDELGYFTYTAEGVTPDECYSYVFENGQRRADPVSRSLPRGVGGPTKIVDPNQYHWGDGGWKRKDYKGAIIYEIHVGTFTPEGSFDGVIAKLDYLLDLGINMIEIMPIAEFPGRWNWGYDGVSLFAPYSGYGGVEGFKRLVDCAHQKGIGICLDVVYNHLGPKGNYLAEFAPYFRENFAIPWGSAFNYEGPYGGCVAEFVTSNALYWANEYHVDALRLDAVQGVFDFSKEQMVYPFAEKIPAHLIAECALNDPRLIQTRQQGGAALDAIWNDDYHHSVHVALTAEKRDYYGDFLGLADIARTVKRGFAYDGERFSEFRQQTYGNSPLNLPYAKFISFIQNHDQVGNRPFGERLTNLVSRQRLKCAAFLSLFSPFTPMLFMGEEYAEKSPFTYFVDFSDKELMRAIFEGRKQEFRNEQMPFPGEGSFYQSKLSWNRDLEFFTLYKTLLSLRKIYAPAADLLIGEIEVYCGENFVGWEYPTDKGEWVALYCYLGAKATLTLPFKRVTAKKVLLATEPVILADRIAVEKEFALLLT